LLGQEIDKEQRMKIEDLHRIARYRNKFGLSMSMIDRIRHSGSRTSRWTSPTCGIWSSYVR